VREMISDLKKTLIRSLSSKSWPSEEEKSRVLQSVEKISVSTPYLQNFLKQVIESPEFQID
ncbi:unnamed protein product, partial [Schistosoma turkestanicum]